MKFPSIEELRARGTRKWTVYEEDVLPLWIAESDFPTPQPVRSAIEAAVEHESFGYTPAASRLPKALADFYEQRYGWRPKESHIVTIGDVVRGMLLGIQYFTRPGSEVVVPVPAYPPFLELAETAGRERIDISAEGGLDLAEVEGAFKAGAGSILLATPNNPMGYVYDEDTLRGLINIADKYDARILVDEIHAPLVYGGKHITPASLGPKAKKVCLTVTATSKAWNIAGLKCAQMIFSNDQDLSTWKNLTGVAKDGTGTLGVFAAAACYADAVEELDEQVNYLHETRDWVISQLEEKIPGISCTTPDATYLLWLDFSKTAIGNTVTPAAWLREHAKVALNEGITFGPGGENHARLNFATSREILAEAINRMAQAIEKASTSS